MDKWIRKSLIFTIPVLLVFAITTTSTPTNSLQASTITTKSSNPGTT